MRRITTSDQELLLEISPCDEDEVDTFTAADCWKLAYELHLKGAGSVVGVAESENPDNWCHMAVELPDGLFLDANGIQDEEQLVTRWSSWLPTTAVIARYNLADSKRWTELTSHQNHNFSAPEDVQEVADKLIEWLEDL